MLNKIQYWHIASVSVSDVAESVNTVLAETENVILVAVSVTSLRP